MISAFQVSTAKFVDTNYKMADHTGGIQGNFKQDIDVLARAVVNAACERFSGMNAEQIPRHNPLGVLKAATSHLSKREERETGKHAKGSLASNVQSALGRVSHGTGKDIENAVMKAMVEKGITNE